MRIIAFIIDGPTVRDILDFLSVIAQWQRTKFSGQMIVSQRHKLIFIKTPETAGTSNQLNLPPISALPRAKSGFCEDRRPAG